MTARDPLLSGLRRIIVGWSMRARPRGRHSVCVIRSIAGSLVAGDLIRGRAPKYLQPLDDLRGVLLIHEDLPHGLGKHDDVVETARGNAARGERHVIVVECVAADYRQAAPRGERVRVGVPNCAGVEVEGSERLVTFCLMAVSRVALGTVYERRALCGSPVRKLTRGGDGGFLLEASFEAI